MEKISNRYAKAFFETVKEKNQIVEIIPFIEEMALVFSNNMELIRFLKNPVLSSEVKLSAIKKIFRNLAKIVNHFFDFLEVKNRISLMPDILQAILKLHLKEQGIERAEFISKEKLDSVVIEKINKKISQKIGAKLVFTEIIDKNLLGGFKIKTQSRLYDFTLDGQIDQLKGILKN